MSFRHLGIHFIVPDAISVVSGVSMYAKIIIELTTTSSRRYSRLAGSGDLAMVDAVS